MLYEVITVLTPALCATMLKPVEKNHATEGRGFFPWFNRVYSRGAKAYRGSVRSILARGGRFMAVFLVMVGVMLILFQNRPTSFLPQEDQGILYSYNFV